MRRNTTSHSRLRRSKCPWDSDTSLLLLLLLLLLLHHWRRWSTTNSIRLHHHPLLLLLLQRHLRCEATTRLLLLLLRLHHWRRSMYTVSRHLCIYIHIHSRTHISNEERGTVTRVSIYILFHMSTCCMQRSPIPKYFACRQKHVHTCSAVHIFIKNAHTDSLNASSSLSLSLSTSSMP